jgi:hypothetical protein
VRTGVVSLPGQRRHPRPVVQWPGAWTYLLGLWLILSAVVLPHFGRPGSSKRSFLITIAAALWVVGYGLLLLSPLLSSVQGVQFLLGAAVFLACIWWVNRRFGKWAAVAAWSAFITGALWLLYACA